MKAGETLTRRSRMKVTKPIIQVEKGWVGEIMSGGGVMIGVKEAMKRGVG